MNNLSNKLPNTLSELVDIRNSAYTTNISEYNRDIKYDINIKHGKIASVIFYIADVKENNTERNRRYSDYIRKYELKNNKPSVTFGRQFVKYIPFANIELLKLLSEIYGVLSGTKIKYKQRNTDSISDKIVKSFRNISKEKKHHMNICSDDGNIMYVLFFGLRRILLYIEYDIDKCEYHLGITEDVVKAEFDGNIFGLIAELLYSVNNTEHHGKE